MAAALDGVIMDNNRVGLRVEDNSRASTIRSSIASSFTGNGAGLVSTGGAIISFGDNSNDGNPITDGAPTSTIPQQ